MQGKTFHLFPKVILYPSLSLIDSSDHIAPAIPEWRGKNSLEWRKRETLRLKAAAARFDAAWNAMPAEWLPENEDASELERERLAAILVRPLTAPAEFWNPP